jgi:Ca2+-binding RTX toxin-like protein
MRLRRATAAVVAAMAWCAAAPAHASEVHVEAIVSASTDGEYVVFTAAPGERNAVTVRYPASGTVRVQDTAGLQTGEGCVAESPTAALCTVSADEFGDQWDLGDRDDRLTIFGESAGAAEGSSIDDGAGNDIVRGGAGDDSIFDGPGRDTLAGGGGDDTLFSGGGADDLSGGTGSDTVSYDPPLGAPRRNGVRADLDGRADDGAAGERDRIRLDVENLDGTEFADRLTGNGRANEIDGGGGADRIFGLGGNDVISGVLGAALIDPGAGADRVEGGRIVRSRDGSRDRISSCGTAFADRRDVVIGCRTVRRG